MHSYLIIFDHARGADVIGMSECKGGEAMAARRRRKRGPRGGEGPERSAKLPDCLRVKSTPARI